MRKKLSLILLSVCILCGCGKTEVVVEESTNLHEVMDMTVWHNITFNAFTPVCYFETVDDTLQIFPYNDNSSYILVREIFISGNNFWATVTKDYPANNCKKTDKYSLITLDNGTTYLYTEKDDETAYLVSSDSLPSYYVEEVGKIICSTNT